jgi:hypothetical protein
MTVPLKVAQALVLVIVNCRSLDEPTATLPKLRLVGVILQVVSPPDTVIITCLLQVAPFESVTVKVTVQLV